MSGIEVAGIVIGIVPIVVAILKSNRALQTRLRTFTRYVEAVRAVQLRHKVAATNFSVDCQLLLKAVVDNAHELSQMIDDPKHANWQDPALEERLQRFLGRNSQVLEDVVVKIREVLQETDTRLSKLDRGSLAEETEGHTKTAPIRRLWRAFDFAIQENEHLKWLDELERWNTRLTGLRAQLCKLRKRQRCVSDCIVRKNVPNRYKDICTASQKLHDSLKNSFSCTNISHVDHQAKLSLDAQAEYDSIQLDMVITCLRRPSPQTLNDAQKPPPEAPIWLQVRSITAYKPATKVGTMLSGLPEAMSASPHTSTMHAIPSKSLNAPSTAKSTDSKNQKKLKRQVRFEASDGSTEPAPDPPAKVSLPRTSRQPMAANFALLDLKTTPSVCCHLSKACKSAQCKELGYLESVEAPQSFTFIFYDAGRNTEANLARNIPGRNSSSVLAKLDHLQTLHQLTLAHKLAMAVLQYHSTSWLPDDWGLSDIAYFPADIPNKPDTPATSEDSITQALQTLHLSTEFPEKTSASHPGLANDPEQLRYMYGIRNLVLAKLGVSLLEIGTKQDLATCNPDSLLTSERVVTARKILHEKHPLLSRLGNQYIKIAQQCIDCDFACGEDLNEEPLRRAVYTDVICVLEDMIAGWKKLMGVK
ncbi:unnamed protein product [Periconia digitata]|uniref:DUF7580 domain-containing protein n=1 Tax=Periconia digitata TaxID=1303443 RepID=A0A9W4UX48_9PLEO|nr:unnamed protein product [Periconia digitata]